jgi:uncharacterized protein (DUF924 family)
MTILLYDFWFSKPYMTFFTKSKSLDRQIYQNYKTCLEYEMTVKDPTPWIRSKTKFVTYVLLFDQIPRHIYRGTPKAYQFDKYICTFVKKHYWKYISSLNAHEILFVLLPFSHSTKIADQRQGIRIYKQILKYMKHFTKDEHKILRLGLRHQLGHVKILRKFGRFPKRNHIYQIESTRQELKYIIKSPHLPY